jgi:hypothetical protein
MDTKTALLAFNPNDFFYYNAQQTQSDDECKTLLDNKGMNCNDMNYFILNDEKCVKQQLCNNKNKAQNIIQTQPNSGVEVRLNDMNELYNIEKINCINNSLGIGIIAILIINKIFIYFSPVSIYNGK